MNYDTEPYKTSRIIMNLIGMIFALWVIILLIDIGKTDVCTSSVFILTILITSIIQLALGILLCTGCEPHTDQHDYKCEMYCYSKSDTLHDIIIVKDIIPLIIAILSYISFIILYYLNIDINITLLTYTIILCCSIIPIILYTLYSWMMDIFHYCCKCNVKQYKITRKKSIEKKWSDKIKKKPKPSYTQPLEKKPSEHVQVDDIV